MVTFVGPSGQQAIAPINPDGTYFLPDPPEGENQILVTGAPGMAPKLPGVGTPTGSPAMPGGAAPEIKQGAAPPAKYGKPNNGLAFKVTGGKQTFDIPLTP